MLYYKEKKVKRTLPVNYKNKDKNVFESEFEKSFDEVEITHINNTTILSNGTCYNKKILFNIFFNSNKNLSKRIFLTFKIVRIFITTNKTIKKEHAILLTDYYSGCFFHWFGDVLQKLEAIENKQESLLNGVFLVPSSCYQSYVVESLKPYQINYVTIDEKVKIFVENLSYVPPISPTGNYRKKLMLSMRKRFANYYKIPNKNKRIYISRKKAPKRRILNEEDIYPILKNNGFKIVAMEDYSFEEQYGLIAESSILVSVCPEIAFFGRHDPI